MKKDLLKLLDLTSEDILEILDTADRLKAMTEARAFPIPSWRERPWP